MKSRGVRIYLAAVAAATVFVSGCSSADSPSSAPAGEPKAGGTLTVLDFAAPACVYGPSAGYTPSGVILNQLTDKLTYQDPETLEIQPWIAESWEVNTEATQFTFTLREGVTFSDGTPLDAAAVAKNFETYGLGDPALKLPVAEIVNNFERSEVIDERTVRFHFSAPSPGFLQGTSTINAALVSPATLALPYEEQCQAENVIGSGPFTIKEIVPDQEIVFEARPDYDWAPESLEHQGRAHLDEVRVVVSPEASVRIGALLSGQADIVRNVAPFDEESVTAKGYELVARTTNGVNNTLNLRMTNSILRDLDVRRALLAATDTQEIVDTLFSDLYPRATSVIAANAPGYVDLSEELEYDPSKAKSLLDGAGWLPGADGIREKDGVRLELSVFVDNSLQLGKQQLELIAQQWAKVGVQLVIKPADAGTRAVDILDPEKTAINHTWVGRADQDVIKSHFHSENRNALQSNDTRLDAILERVASSPTEEERNEYVAEAQRYVIENAYSIPILEEPLVYGVAPYVEELAFEAVGRPSFYSVWLNK